MVLDSGSFTQYSVTGGKLWEIKGDTPAGKR